MWKKLQRAWYRWLDCEVTPPPAPKAKVEPEVHVAPKPIRTTTKTTRR